MSRTTTHKTPWTGYALFASAGLLCLGIIIFLAVSVSRDLRLLNSASSDNVQWALSQTDVEFLEFDAQLNSAIQSPEQPLSDLRQEFDIFYSRIATLSRGSVHAQLRDDAEFKASQSAVQRFLDETVPFIDSPDAELRKHLADIQQNTGAIRQEVRKLSNSGLSFFANGADQRRRDISRTLTELAIIVAAMVIVLLAFAYYLSRLNAQNSRRGRETLMTSKRMNTVMATSLDGVIVTDADGLILEFNNAAEMMFGHASKDVFGKTIGDVIVPDHFKDAHDAGMERMRTKGEKRVVGKGRVQLEAKRHDGEIFPVELAIQTAETDDGDIFIAFLRDISKRVQDQQELIEARDKALAGEKAKSNFLAVMSHEIRTPLNGLLGNLELLQDTKVTMQQAELIGHMKTSGRLLMSHVTDVLDISRYDAGKLEIRLKPLNLNVFLQDLIDNQSGPAAEQKTSLTWRWVGGALDWVNADQDVMQAILLNLIGNAVKFTREGSVSLEVEEISKTAGKSLVEFRITDSGIGISEEAQARIFEDFATGSVSYNRVAGGTGLGLGIAKRFTTALGGEIGAESTLGEGSVFWVRLRLENAADAMVEAGQVQIPEQARAKSVLVVEDNEINRQVVREMLRNLGHRVAEAVDGLSGVEMAKSEQFDLILMDISMPVMDGREATRAIRSSSGASANVPIVALTANVMAEERTLFLEDGMDDVLSKPLTKRALSALMDSIPRQSEQDEEKLGLIDETQFHETKETLPEALFNKHIAKLFTETQELIAWLPIANPDDRSEIAGRVHKAAGGVAMFGATEMHAALRRLETEVKSEAPLALDRSASELDETWQATKAAMEQLI